MVTEPPLFILGVGRSGTTWVQRALLDRATYSPLTKAADKLRSARGKHVSFGRLGEPAEGYRLWSSVAPSLLTPVPRPWDWLPPESECRALRSTVEALRRGDRTVVVKCTAFSRHASTLLHVFPEARVICVWRDPEAVVDSFLRVAFWPALRLWPRFGRMPMEYDVSEQRTLAAELWQREASTLLSGLGQHTSVRHLQYERLIADPASFLRALDGLDYPADQTRRSALPEPNRAMRNLNLGWPETSPLVTGNSELAPLAHRLEAS